MALADVLPANFNYTVVKSDFKSSNEFKCTLRSNIKCGEDFKSWLEDFVAKTSTSWNLRSSKDSDGMAAKFQFLRDFICHHSSYRKRAEDGKDKACKASLKVRIKKDNKYTRCRDKYVEEGLLAILKIDFQHSHRNNVAEAWNWLKRTDETKSTFTTYFNEDAVMWYSASNGAARAEPQKGGGRKLKKFLIILDNDTLLYHPGSFLSGSVLVELENDTPVTGLYFHIVGEGVVRLAQRGSSGYDDKENYIDFKMRMLGEGPPVGGGGRMMILSPGVHTFPFKLGLPLGLPSTFLAKHGWVQYYCKAELKEAGVSALTHKNQQVFIVMNPIDLNLEPSLLMQPFHCEITERVGIPCLSAGSIVCRIRLDRGGYVPGENICIYAAIDNTSRVTIARTKATLTETIQYTAKNKLVHTESRELASLQKGRIASGGGDQWHNALLHIPPLPPTNLRGCHLIRIQYDVYFVIEPKGLDRPIKLQLPIMIATYPARNKDGTLKRRGRLPAYPTLLPMFRT